MDVLKNQKGEAAAYYLQNWIIDQKSLRVIGVVLGHCVFDIDGTICGKFFKRTLRTLGGEIVVTLEYENPDRPREVKFDELMKQAWDIITKIDDHACPAVEEISNWSDQTIYELLRVSS